MNFVCETAYETAASPSPFHERQGAHDRTMLADSSSASGDFDSSFLLLPKVSPSSSSPSAAVHHSMQGMYAYTPQQPPQHLYLPYSDDCRREEQFVSIATPTMTFLHGQQRERQAAISSDAFVSERLEPDFDGRKIHRISNHGSDSDSHMEDADSAACPAGLPRHQEAPSAGGSSAQQDRVLSIISQALNVTNALSNSGSSSGGIGGSGIDSSLPSTSSSSSSPHLVLDDMFRSLPTPSMEYYYSSSSLYHGAK
eukprot:CAMPEP_0119558838 /NCGR_PEP_ID=MMETSP1352-20130426/11350_1 /TAXON_ID=265584 /ORGANISM="Stauroneis constricta, Strain CCMP1120" /LENGTH=253 /DNA_ID=CAMNT_0007606313 /DNA_START=95 /DNA_END=856 /DNA_ORIENTATION=+